MLPIWSLILQGLFNLNRAFVSFIKTGGMNRFYSTYYNKFYSTLYVNNREAWNGADYSLAGNGAVNRTASYNKDLDPIVTCQLQIGGKLFPEYPIQSSQEACYLMRNQ